MRVHDGGGEKGKPQHGPLIKKEKNSSAKKIAKLCMPYNHMHVQNTKTLAKAILLLNNLKLCRQSYHIYNIASLYLIIMMDWRKLLCSFKSQEVNVDDIKFNKGVI